MTMVCKMFIYRGFHMLFKVLTLAMVMGSCLLQTSLSGQAPAESLQLSSYLDWETVANPRISPDGGRILYSRGWVDKLKDRRRSSIWIMNSDGTRNRVLMTGSGATWSPDGLRIAFTAEDEAGNSQIFVRWMDSEGATTQITRTQESAANLRWSPDGKQIAFTMNVQSAESEWSIELPQEPDGAEWVDGPKVVERLTYRRDRRGYIDEGYTHVFTVPAEAGTPRQISNGDWNHSAAEWMPDGLSLVFSSLRVDEAEHVWRESEIYQAVLGTGEINQLTDRHGPDTGPVPSPDGRYIAYQGQDFNDDTYRENQLYIMESDGSNPRSLGGEMGRSLGNITWNQDGSGVYFNVSMHGTQNLWFAPVDGQPYAVTNGNHMLSMASMDTQGVAVGVLSSYHQPGDLVSFGTRIDAPIHQLTHVNDDILEGVTLGNIEEMWYKSVDDFDIQGWIIKPPNFDESRKYPLMLSIHGGPHGMYNVGFNFGWQEHAANGYVILYTNPRGSSGYGSPFGNAIKNAYPDKDFDDLMAGVDEVVSRGYVDDDNMFVYGCSGGGVLTSWVVGHTDRFAAASANCPVTNWLSFVGTTDGATWYKNFAEYPWDDPSEHLRRSPLMYVGNVTTPTMLNDWGRRSSDSDASDRRVLSGIESP